METTLDTSGSGQESARDYPTPPRVEPSSGHVRVVFNGKTVADSRSTLRMLETGRPPVYFVPFTDVAAEYLRPSRRHTYATHLGRIRYRHLCVDGVTSHFAACYVAEPPAAYEAVRDHLAFFPARVDACFVDGQTVCAPLRGSDAGWITGFVAGPFTGPRAAGGIRG